MEPTSSSSKTLQPNRAEQNESASNYTIAEGSSSSIQWQPKAGAFALLRHNPQLAHIHVVAGSEYSEDPEQSQNGSVDCAVEVQVVVQQTQPVKPEAQPQPPPKRSRSRLRCCGIVLLVLGLLATGVLVPIAVTVGFKTEIPPEYRVLQPPQPSHRLIFAFSSSATAASAGEVFPADIASKVSSWTALPSSAIHVAAFSDAQSLQQALAHLEAGVSTSPTRHLLSSNSTWSLKYAVADFALLTDRRVSQVVDPMQLFDLAKQQTRYLLQQQQQQHGAATQPLVDPDIDEDYCLWQLQMRTDAWHQQQLRARQTAAAEAASTSGVPRTAVERDAGEQHTRHRHLMAMQQQQQGPATAVGAETELLPVVWREPAGATSTVPQLPPAAHTAEAGLHLTGHAFQKTAAYSSSSSWGSIARRALLQSAARAVPARGRPQLQVHQRQAQQQVQRGGSQVAWHLTNTGLGLREAWNVTSGMDRVVVAVIDSGVEVASSAVGAALWTNAAEVAGDGIDNDGNGYEDDVTGWDFGGACADVECSYCTPGPDPTDVVGWGTHAAAAIGAQPEVASGTAGISPGVRIMPLKVSDCRNGMQLWDVTTQQGGLVKALDSTGSGDSSGAAAEAAAVDPVAQLASQQGLGPALLGSAAVQAMDYALLNGAHIVLTAWTAGGSITGDDNQCVMGAAAAAAEGVDAAVARGGPGCLAAVQRLVFQDALKPLQEAGVLVVTTQDSRSTQDAPAPAAAAAGPPLPCSLSCDFDNVLCVSASTTMLPPAGSQGGLTDVLSASDFFAPLTDQHSRSYYAWAGASTDEDSSDPDSTGDDSSSDSGAGQETDSLNSAAAQAGRAAARSSSLRYVKSACEARSSSGMYAQLRAPGTDILAGWAWGSHALVSGSSAAASVAAGAAALTWSKLGQTLGADASPGAFEGLGQQVKQQLLQGTTVSVITNGSRSSSSDTSSSDASSSGSAFVPLRQAARAGPGSTGSPQRSNIMSSSPAAATAPGVPAPELDLFGALQEASQAPGVVSLQPAVLSSAVTSACKALRYTWHIRAEDSGPYDTNAMWYVARKALKPPGFPITRWEFYGSTSLLEATAYLDVGAPGVYELSASSEDRFVLWLQDWWLHMREAPERGPGMWSARVNFMAPGLYKLRLIIYSPSKPFDLQWKPSTSNSFVPITSYVSLGQTQPLPQQLLQTMLLPLAATADSSIERSSRVVATGSGSSKAKGHGSSSQGTIVASSSSSSSAPSFESLPEAPGGQVSEGSGTAGDTTSSSSGGSDGVSGLGMGAPPAWSPEDDASSLNASMEPPEGASDEKEPMLAADVTPEDDSAPAAAAPGIDGVPYAPAVSGYQLRPTFAPYLAGAGDVGFGGGGGDLLGSLRSFFAGGGSGGWFGRRRLSHRRSLLMSEGSEGLADIGLELHSGDRRSFGVSAGDSVARVTGNNAAGGMKQQQPQIVLAQPQLRRLAASAAAAPATPPAAPRSSRAGSGSSPWGRFSLAVTFPEKTQYRTLTPDVTKLEFTHAGVLPGPGLAIGGWLNLQEAVLGFSDPQDNRGAYGMIQGWLDWRDLNPAAAATITAASGAAAATPAAAAAVPLGSSSNGITVEGAGLGGTLGGVSVGSAGVQFEVQCDDCSLQIDGMTVAGSLGPPETSSCVVPAATAARRSSSSGDSTWAQQKQQQLLHVELLFSTNDARNVKVSVQARPCNGVHSMAGSGAWMPLTAAGSSPPAFSVASSAVSKDNSHGHEGSTSFKRGMLCTIQALPPAGTAAAAAPGSDGVVGSGGELQRSVFLSAERMREAVAVPVNETGAVNAAAMVYTSSKEPDSSSNNSSSNATSTTTSSSSGNAQSLTVDAPAWNGDEAGPTGPPRTNTTANMTAEQVAQAAAEAAARAAELKLRAAQTAAAKAAALSRGITVAELVPDWVASLPAETKYSLSCGCYWNGSWDGNVSVAVSLAAEGSGGGSTSSSGHARLFLAGWPVAAKVGRALGPSDVDVRAYSTLLQRQQLAAGSESADPLVDTAYLWAAGGLFGAAGSSADASSVTSRLLGGGADSSSRDGSALSAAAVRARRASRMQQQSVSRSSSSASSAGSSSLLGLQPLGSVDGVSRRVVMPGAGQHQLLVLQAEDVTGDTQVVILAPGDTSTTPSSSGSSGSMLAAGGDGSSNSIVSSWLPGAWDAWVPAG